MSSQQELDVILAKHGAEPGEMTHSLKQAIKSLIRTEKLKLLAEVRERVVGEDEPDERGWYVKDGGYHRDVVPLEYHRNELRTHQRVALNKLEAEL